MDRRSSRIDKSTAPRLCGTCSEINFLSLIYQTRYCGEKPKVYRAAPILLGSLQRLMVRSVDCDLCALIIDTAVRRYRRTLVDRPSTGIGPDRGAAAILKPKGKDGMASDKKDLMPTTIEGEPIFVKLRHVVLGSIKDEEVEDSQGRKLIEIYRLRVDLEPCHWSKDFNKGLIFQALWRLPDEAGLEQCLDGSEPDFQLKNLGRPALGLPSSQPASVLGTGRLVSPQLDLGLMKRWLATCEQVHGSACSYPVWFSSHRSEISSWLRLVDVQAGCLVAAPSGARYLCLSYVWGDQSADPSRRSSYTLKRNLRAMQTPGGLFGINLPLTVTDAMALVRQLGERYLWVDALCLVQDDAADVLDQISKMDLVYSNALLTLVAVSGDDADAGLPGVRPEGRAVHQPAATVLMTPTGALLSLIPSLVQGTAYTLQESRWNSRGWTFQERLLSRRSLLFAKNEIYWNCESSIHDEETILEAKFEELWPRRFGCYDEFDDAAPKFSLAAYDAYAIQFSLKDFTHAEDALPAIRGVLQRIEHHTGEQFHWGILEGLFDEGLAWTGERSGRRDAMCPFIAEDGTTYRIKYPSWTWLGWKGPVVGGYNPHLYQRIRAGQEQHLLKFYAVRDDGSLLEIKMAGSPVHGEAQDCSSKDTSHWLGRTELGGDVLSWDIAIDLGSPSKLKTHEGRDTGMIAFWTSVARVWFRKKANGQDYVVQLPGARVQAEVSWNKQPSMLAKPRPALDGRSASVAEYFEMDCVVISKHHSQRDEPWRGSLNLMIVEWIRPAVVARRVGMTNILESEWIKLDRTWQRVVLQ